MCSTYIIADQGHISAPGTTEHILADKLDAEPFEGGRTRALSSGDRIVVYADSREFGGSSGGRSRSLDTLELALAQMRGVDFIHLLIIGFLKPEQYGDFSDLIRGLARKNPEAYRRLPCGMQVIRDSLDNSRFAVSDLSSVIKKSAECQKEKLAARIRHAYLPQARGAVRVALGAYFAGDLSQHSLRTCIEKLAPYATAALSSVERETCLKDLEQIVGEPRFVRETGKPVNDVLLWEDDDITRNSWKAVLDEIFACWHSKGLSPTSHAVTTDLDTYTPDAKAGKVEELALVLLDYHLGEDLLGGSLLRPFRNRALDLPIVMFSASDEAVIAKWCLAHGASDYFVKELTEQEDRRSEKHYRLLKSVLVGQLGNNDNRSIRKLYRSYVDRGALAAQSLDEQQKKDWGWVATQASRIPRVGGNNHNPFREENSNWDPVDWHLRQMFRYLLGEPFWVEEALGLRDWRASAYDHAYAAAEAAVEAMRARQMCLQNHHISRRCAGPEPNLNAMVRFALREKWFKSPRMNLPPRAAILAHSCSPSDTDIPLSSCVQMGRYAIELVVKCAESLPTIIETGRVLLPALGNPSPLNPPAVPLRAGQLNHASEAVLGACEFASHVYESLLRDEMIPVEEGVPCRSFGDMDEVKFVFKALPSPSAPATVSVLFVDDSVTEDQNEPGSYADAWSYTLHKTLAYAGIEVKAINNRAVPMGEDSALLVREHDVVLLDLHMPKEADGLRRLKDLKKEAPEVPVVMLTASNASGPVRAALRAGASAYFLKRRGRPATDRTRFDELVEIIKSLSEFGCRIGKLREVYHRVDSIRPNVTDSRSLRAAIQDIGWCLKGAWSHLWLAEATRPGQSLRGPADQWLAGALSSYKAVAPQVGAAALVYIACGKVVEQIGRNEGLLSRMTYTQAMKTLDGMRGRGTDFAQRWQQRTDAVHGLGMGAFPSLQSLCSYVIGTVELVEWHLANQRRPRPKPSVKTSRDPDTSSAMKQAYKQALAKKKGQTTGE